MKGLFFLLTLGVITACEQVSDTASVVTDTTQNAAIVPVDTPHRSMPVKPMNDDDTASNMPVVPRADSIQPK